MRIGRELKDRLFDAGFRALLRQRSLVFVASGGGNGRRDVDLGLERGRFFPRLAQDALSLSKGKVVLARRRYSFRYSRSRRVCVRLTGISVAFASFILRR